METVLDPAGAAGYIRTNFQWIGEIVDLPTGLFQVGAIAVCFLIARIISGNILDHFEKAGAKTESSRLHVLSPAQFTTVLNGLFWALLLWFFRVLFQKLQIPFEFLRMAINLVVALTIVRFSYFYIKNTFWARLISFIIFIFLLLRILKLWAPTMVLLDGMQFSMGSIRVSFLGVVEAAVTFIMLWAVASAVNRFIAHWLMTGTDLTHSDRTLLLRVVRAGTAALVILISLKAAGIDMAAIVVTGGAIGFSIGIGLQKIGSNLVSGIILLISKPIRQGDVITFEESFSNARWGWVTRLGLMYVEVATRKGTQLIVPNEVFITQRIENLSFQDNLIRLEIPVGVSYESDLDKAALQAVMAANSIERVLRIPEAKCMVKEFGDSTVNLVVRVWINDPKNGIDNLKNAVLLKIWERFHETGIEIAFPQRDLHIKSAVPLQIARGKLHSAESPFPVPPGSADEGKTKLR